METDEPLTLGRLLQERALRAVEVTDGAALARRVAWCVPWEVALADETNILDAVVFARADQVEPAGLARIAAGKAAAVLVAGTAPDTSPHLPVLSAPERLGFREVSHLVADLTLARETHVLRYGRTVHRSLVELLYRGAGVSALCHQMSRLANSAAAVLDPHLRVIAFAQARDRVYEPGAVAAALRGRLPDLGTETARPAVVRLEPIDTTAVVNPILLGGRHDGWVLILEAGDPPHPHDLAEHRVVVEQGATIVGTELLRTRSVEQAEERAKGDFVHALLHARFTTGRELAARATYYDFPTNGSFGVVVAGGVYSGGSSDSLTTLFQLARDTSRLDPQAGRHTLATVVGDVLTVIRQLRTPGRDGSPDAATRELAGYARSLESELARRVGRPVTVAYGRPVDEAMRIVDSYQEARLTLQLRRRLGIDEVCGFQDLRVYATLAELARSPAGAAFAADVLGPLRRHRPGAGELEHAVLTYIAAGGNLNAAARDLHIHRNTMLYKLDRASRALRLDLRQAEHQFTVWLAHKLDLLAEVSQAVDRDLPST